MAEKLPDKIHSYMSFGQFHSQDDRDEMIKKLKFELATMKLNKDSVGILSDDLYRNRFRDLN